MSEGDKIDSNAWMVTFADLVMLLLTFFVLLLTMSSMDEKKLENLFTHFREATGVLSFGQEESIYDLTDLIEKYYDLAKLLVIDQRDFLRTVELSVDLKDEIKKKMYIEDDERGIVLSFHSDILFDPGKAKIKKEVFPILDALADAIEGCSNDINIMGHTDNASIKNEFFKSNWKLSVYRGLAVLEYFLKESELTPSRFSVGGYGPSRPVKPNNTLESRAFNRRVEIIFKHF